ncbi:hypothetical protein CBL_07726 [Carabus blaptoides fortunei]
MRDPHKDTGNQPTGEHEPAGSAVMEAYFNVLSGSSRVNIITRIKCPQRSWRIDTACDIGNDRCSMLVSVSSGRVLDSRIMNHPPGCTPTPPLPMLPSDVRFPEVLITVSHCEISARSVYGTYSGGGAGGSYGHQSLSQMCASTVVAVAARSGGWTCRQTAGQTSLCRR